MIRMPRSDLQNSFLSSLCEQDFSRLFEAIATWSVRWEDGPHNRNAIDCLFESRSTVCARRSIVICPMTFSASDRVERTGSDGFLLLNRKNSLAPVNERTKRDTTLCWAQLDCQESSRYAACRQRITVYSI